MSIDAFFIHSGNTVTNPANTWENISKVSISFDNFSDLKATDWAKRPSPFCITLLF